MFFDEYVWYITIKNLSILKLNHLSKTTGAHYPAWINGILFYNLEQRQYLGPVAPDMSRMMRVPSLPRLPSNPDMVGGHHISFTRAPSFENFEGFTSTSTDVDGSTDEKQRYPQAVGFP